MNLLGFRLARFLFMALLGGLLPLLAFDPERDISPFDPVKVRDWPGLPNQGRSCFTNAVVKTLAALPALDPLLADQPADPPATARVRRHLRTTINFIRSGGVTATAAERDASAQIKGLLAAFAGHPKLQHYGEDAKNLGGNPKLMVTNLLEVLGDRYALSPEIASKEVPIHDPGQSQYRIDRSFPSLTVSMNQMRSGYDLTNIHSIGAFWEWRCAHPGNWGDGDEVSSLPTHVPDTFLVMVAHSAPNKALTFSEDLTFPVYAVNPVQRTEVMAGQVSMRAVAVAVGHSDHVWAMVRGEDGWYENNDRVPSHRVSAEELNERVGPQGAMVKEYFFIIYKRK